MLKTSEGNIKIFAVNYITIGRKRTSCWGKLEISPFMIYNLTEIFKYVQTNNCV